MSRSENHGQGLLGWFGRNRQRAQAAPQHPIDGVTPQPVDTLIQTEQKWNPTPAFFTVVKGEGGPHVQPETEQTGQYHVEFTQGPEENTYRIDFIDQRPSGRLTTWEQIIERYGEEIDMPTQQLFEKGLGITPALFDALDGDINFYDLNTLAVETLKRLDMAKAGLAAESDGQRILHRFLLQPDAANSSLMHIEPDAAIASSEASALNQYNFAMYKVVTTPDGYLHAVLIPLTEASTIDTQTEHLVIASQADFLAGGFPMLTPKEPTFWLNRADTVAERHQEATTVQSSAENIANVILEMTDHQALRRSSYEDALPQRIAVIPASLSGQEVWAQVHRSTQGVLRILSFRTMDGLEQINESSRLTDRAVHELKRYITPDMLVKNYYRLAYSDRVHADDEFRKLLAQLSGTTDDDRRATINRYTMLRELITRGILKEEQTERQTRGQLAALQLNETLVQVHTSGRIHQYTRQEDGSVMHIKYNYNGSPVVEKLIPDGTERIVGIAANFRLHQDPDPNEAVLLEQLFHFSRLALL